VLTTTGNMLNDGLSIYTYDAELKGRLAFGLGSGLVRGDTVTETSAGRWAKQPREK
jgi:hypothetical protein